MPALAATSGSFKSSGAKGLGRSEGGGGDRFEGGGGSGEFAGSRAGNASGSGGAGALASLDQGRVELVEPRDDDLVADGQPVGGGDGRPCWPPRGPCNTGPTCSTAARSSRSSRRCGPCGCTGPGRERLPESGLDNKVPPPRA